MRLRCTLLILLLTAAPGLAAGGREGPVRCLSWQIPEITGITPAEVAEVAARGRDRELPCDHTPVGPPADPQVGDSWDWYIWSLDGMPEATLESCTVRGMGAHHYVVVQDSAWNVSMTQADVDAVSDAIENHSVGEFPDEGIWSLNTSTFGEPPDGLDQDGKVYFLYYEFDVAADGFFWYFDQACDGELDFASNECDVVYLSCAGAPPAGDYMLAVAAHEFQHLIHFAQDANEVSWVEEGLGELAMWLFGHPDTISGFPGNPDNNLTTWNGNWSDYIKTYLWTLYFYERYGGRPSIFALVAEQANSVAGYDAVLANLGYEHDFAGAFANWTVANYLDDPTIGSGEYGYLGTDLPAFQHAADHAAYPAGQSSDVKHWAADYVGFTGAAPLEVHFDGADGPGFAAFALGLGALGGTTVQRLALDAQQAGWTITPGDATEVVMVLAKNSGSGAGTYDYSADLASSTPTPVPTSAPSPTPTAIPGETPWMGLELSAAVFGAGDPFELVALFVNPLAAAADVSAFVALDVYGSYWFWPSWRPLDEGLDFAAVTLPAQSYERQTLLAFAWPPGSGAATGICFYGIFLDPETSEMLGDLAVACFGFDA